MYLNGSHKAVLLGFCYMDVNTRRLLKFTLNMKFVFSLTEKNEVVV
jgi:hypothetical protein